MQMTPEQKKLLEPFGNVLANWDQQIAEMPPNELAELEAACRATSPTNCWCCTYDAAHLLLSYIDLRKRIAARLRLMGR